MHVMLVVLAISTQYQSDQHSSNVADLHMKGASPYSDCLEIDYPEWVFFYPVPVGKC
jgi:hypothetical protein